MNKLLLFLAVGAAVVATASITGCAPAEEADPEASLETEVAVRVAKLELATVRAYVTAYGVVEPEPAGGGRQAASTSVAPSLPGVVVAVNCAEGQLVRRGDMLFQLDSRAADVAVDFAEKSLQRQRQLMEVEGTSGRALQEAEQLLDAARVQQELLRVRAPLAGTVTRVSVAAGEAVDLTTSLAQIVDLDRLVVSASVPSAELAALEAGQPAEVLIDKKESPVAGTLAFISPAVDAQTGTGLARVALPTGSGLRPGQFVTLRIVSDEHENRLVAPADSVVKDEEGQPVIAIVENGMAVRTPVQVGLRDGERVEIEAPGLRAGMQVVTEGAYALPERTRVQVLAD